MLQKNLLPQFGVLNYYPKFFSSEQSSSFFKELQHTIEWKQESIFIFGKKILQPRLTALYSNTTKPYSYSGQSMIPKPFPTFLLKIKSEIEKTEAVDFTHCLLNFYRDGNDSMGWHRDNEKSLGPNPTIASVSFGGQRIFNLRLYSSKKDKISVRLENGSLLVMKGESQHYWEHQIPKVRLAEPRFNLTFRIIL